MTYNSRGAGDPYARPDLLPADEAQDADIPLFDPFGEAWTACACCGASVPQLPYWACPLCGWTPDSAAPDSPSEENDGLTLAEARLHFGALGRCKPWHLP